VKRHHLVLASASPTRLRQLQLAGFDPTVHASDVDESVPSGTGAAAAVTVLAERKARAVASSFPESLVLGCDSLVEHDGEVLGKASSPAEALEWWRSMRGRRATVWTGQCLAHRGTTTARTTSAVVRFGTPDDDELDAYVRTPEPMAAAGAFRLDGYASVFVEAVEGDPGTVHGVSLPAFRAMLADVGIQVHELWR